MRLVLGVCCVLLLSTTVLARDDTDEETGENFDADMKKAVPRTAGKTIGGDGDDFDDEDVAMDDDDMMMPPGGEGEMGVEDEPEPAKPLEPLDYTTPMPQGFYYFADPFLDTKGLGKRWHVSTAKKEGTDDAIAKYDGVWEIGLPEKVALKNDYGLIVKSKARHHAIAAKLDRPVQFDGKPLVVQYEVKYQNGQECGGGYMKLLSKGAEKDLKNFQDKTPYTIMFGPDKCGMTSKVHFIIRYENPKNHTISEYHAKPTTKSLDDYFSDHKSHLYTLIINPDHTYQILVDQQEITSGNMLKDLEPSMTPPKEIDDPEDNKPEEWDDREKIVDPEAKKPEDWDEDAPKEIEDSSAKKPADWIDDEEDLIPDPEAAKPDDWDTEMDGEWEAPRLKNPKCEGVSGCGEWKAPKIANPAYKGKWKAPKITNPNFKGHWSPRRIENPHYFEPEPYKMTPITAIGLELWTMSEGILFDNFLITDDKLVADNFAKHTWLVKSTQENIVQKATASKEGFFNGLVSAAEERPWLWAVYILTVLLPIVLITVFCFSGNKDKTGARKKTDEVQPDMPEDEQELEEEEEEKEPVKQSPKKADKSPSRRSSPRKQTKGKAALEDDEEEEEVEEEQADETGDTKVATPKGSPGRRVRQRRQD